MRKVFAKNSVNVACFTGPGQTLVMQQVIKKTVFVYHKLINSCLYDAIPSQFDHSSETSLAGPAGCSNDG